MDKLEAKQILSDEIAKYRSRTFLELQRLLSEQDTFEITSSTGKWYQLEFQAVWDGRPQGNLRVIGSIDDGGVSAFKPLCEDFILSPDGKLIGE